MQTTQIRRAHLEAEVLAQKFLLKLGAVYIGAPDEDLGLDYLAIFEGHDESLKIVGVEVKVGGLSNARTHSQLSKLSEKFQNSNLPILLLFVDTKAETIECGWLNIRNKSNKDLGDPLNGQLIKIDDNSISAIKSFVDNI